MERFLPKIRTALRRGADSVDDADHSRRIIHFLHPTTNREYNFAGNEVTTSKYSTFPLSLRFLLWKNLFEQFQRAANLYFLMISVLQVIPGLSPTGRYTTLVPLLIVLFVTMIKDAWEDWKRRVADREVNHRECGVFRDGKWVTVRWADLVTGDVCAVRSGESFPADLALIWTPDELCYVETAMLDGETNLKPRKVPAPIILGTRHLEPERPYDVPCPTFFSGSSIVCELPNDRLYHFDGYMSWMENGRQHPRVPLVADNILLRGATLRNAKVILGIAIFAGPESKLMKNATNEHHKTSFMDGVTNRQILLVFVFQIVLAIISVIGFRGMAGHYDSHWYLGYGRDPQGLDGQAATALLTFTILFNSFIPISLYVMLEMVRLAQAQLINYDAEMFSEERQVGAVTRTSKLNEELGQVSYVFSDKTGTLTCNKMEFRCFSCFALTPPSTQSHPGNGSIQSRGMNRVTEHTTATPVKEIPHVISYGDTGNGVSKFTDARVTDGAWREQANHEQISELLRAMAVCHTVIPEADADGNLQYQAASPDEWCLVKLAADLGIRLVKRSDTSITICDGDTEYVWGVVCVMEFSSNRKRMSIIVRDPNGHLLLLSKGADSVIMNKLKRREASKDTFELLDKYASEGLRTLVYAKLEISDEQYLRWKRRFDAACTAISDRQEKIDAASDEIEREMELIGTTAIEDRLQDNVPRTIHLLSQAGLKLWVLTGDKQETAINIGYSCSLLNPNMGLFTFDACTPQNIRHALEKYLLDAEAAEVESGQDIGLVIQGCMLHHILPTKDNPNANEIEADLFVSLATRCKAVICCRVSPIQKAQVVQAVKERVGSVTLAIGDGANDVSMIQTAHVGVGISGLEGLQAARSSDFSIGEFQFLARLLLVHGRWSYRRIAKLVVFAFYKNTSLYMTQFWFCMFNMFTGQTLYDSWALAMYNLAFTSFPIMALAIFDRDCEPRRLLSTDQFPELYQAGMKNQLFNTTEFWKYTGTAFLHSIFAFFLPYFLWESAIDPSTGRTTGITGNGIAGYSIVLLIVTVKCGLETASWTVVNVVFVVASVLIWIIFLAIYSTFFSWIPIVSDFADWYGANRQVLSLPMYWLLVLLVPTMALLRDFAYKAWRRNFNPTLAHCVQAFEATRPHFDREDVRRAVPWLFPRHEVKVFKPSLTGGVGNHRFLGGKDSTEMAQEELAMPMLREPATGEALGLRLEASPGRRQRRIDDIIAQL